MPRGIPKKQSELQSKLDEARINEQRLIRDNLELNRRLLSVSHREKETHLQALQALAQVAEAVSRAMASEKGQL